MQSDEYLTSEEVEQGINNILSNQKVTNDAKKKADIKALLLKAYNIGFFSSLENKKSQSNMGDIEKSQSITEYLPSNFKKSETGEFISGRVMESILANTTDYVLNIGYEDIVKTDIDDALQVAYSIGITAGFSIAKDDDMSSMFSANLERFIKKGKGKER